MPPDAPIGFVGLGTMGEPMARVLHAQGASLVGYDVRTEVPARLEREGVLRAARDPVELAQRCTAIVTMLPTSAHLERFLFGDAGVADALRDGTLLVDMSSGEPAATRGFAQRLAARGVAIVDAPVSGNVVRARAGDLAIMLGGDTADCDRAEPLLRPLARAVFRTGPRGSGQAMKALNNLASAAGFWIASEVLAIGRKAGLEPEVMLDVLNASTGANNSTQHKFRPWVLSGTYQGHFLMQLMVKDLGIAATLAQQTGAHAPMASEVLAHWREALAALGDGADHTEAARYVAARSGTTLG